MTGSRCQLHVPNVSSGELDLRTAQVCGWSRVGNLKQLGDTHLFYENIRPHRVRRVAIAGGPVLPPVVMRSPAGGGSAAAEAQVFEEMRGHVKPNVVAARPEGLRARGGRSKPDQHGWPAFDGFVVDIFWGGRGTRLSSRQVMWNCGAAHLHAVFAGT